MSSARRLFSYLLLTILILTILIVANVAAQTKTLAERLGYPPSKLLILHADDLAVAHSEDSASFEALDQGLSPPPASWCLAPGSRKSPTTPSPIPTPTSDCISR